MCASELRHFVDSKCKKAGLDDKARAWMMGHDSMTYDHSMGAYYHNPVLEEILNEQKRALPFGALADMLGPKVKIEDRNPEAHTLTDKYLEGKMSTMEFANLMEGLRLKALSNPIPPTLTPSNLIGQRA